MTPILTRRVLHRDVVPTISVGHDGTKRRTRESGPSPRHLVTSSRSVSANHFDVHRLACAPSGRSLNDAWCWSPSSAR
jgi:hypothetical protein